MPSGQLGQVCAGTNVLPHAGRRTDKQFLLLAYEEADEDSSAFVRAMVPGLTGLFRTQNASTVS